MEWGKKVSELQFNAVSRMLNAEVSACGDDDLTFRIHYWGIEWRHYSNPVHRHSFYEVCYVLEGEGEYEDEGVTCLLRGGSQFVSVPGRWHQIRSRSGLKMFFVAYELTDAGRSASGIAYETALQEKAVPVIVDHENVSALLWRTLFLEAGSVTSAIISAARMRRMAGMLLASFAPAFVPNEKEKPVEMQPPKSNTLLVTMARMFIRDNLSRLLKLSDVASYLNVSERHLSRLFRQDGGETFGEYLTKERLRQAETMLKTTERSTKEIAAETGFQSVHYFTRTFSHHYGVPPARFRKMSMGQGKLPPVQTSK